MTLSPIGWIRAVGMALFRDLPREIDRVFRTFEYQRHRLYAQTQTLARGQSIHREVRARHPVILLAMATLVFGLLGPSYGSVCTVFGPRGYASIVLVASVIVVAYIAYRVPSIVWWARAAIERADIAKDESLRRFSFAASLYLGTTFAIIGIVSVLVAFTSSAFDINESACVVRGDHFTSASLQLVMLLVLGWLCISAHRFGPPLQQLPIGVIFAAFSIAAVANLVLTFFVGGAEGLREASDAPYFNLYLPSIFVLLLVAYFADVFCERMFEGLQTEHNHQLLSEKLANTELFEARAPIANSETHVVYALLSGVLSHGSFILFPASFTAMVLPESYLRLGYAIMIFVALLLMIWSRLSDRWDVLFSMIRRWFFVGWPTVISYVIIAIASARMLGISYITTVIESAPLGYLFSLMLLSYGALWFFEYWLNRPLTKQYLRLLGASPGADQFKYAIECESPTTVSAGPRWLQAHGIGRIATVGYYTGAENSQLAWHTYSHSDLLDKLRSAVNTQPQNTSAVRDILNDMKRRSSLYFNTINVLIALLLFIAAFLSFRASAQLVRQPIAQVIEVSERDSRVFSLANRLRTQCTGTGACNSIVALAASGGGSRAALHTTAVLRGLSREDRLADVAVASGVSGGGVALAYFAAYRDALIDNDDANVWQCFEHTMSRPFIQQVIESVGEYRLWRESSLAQVLSESFADSFYASNPTCRSRRADSGARQFIDVSGLGLILNATVVGHPAVGGGHSAVLGAPATRQSKEFAGARMAFTNLRETSAFPSFVNDPEFDQGLYAGAPALPFKLVRGTNFTLAQAAALNANFPPVFSNSRVLITDELGHTQNFHVTDGGVTENRGLISLVLALQSATATLPEMKRATYGYPDIDIVIADASAIDFIYRNDRGIGAAISGGPQTLIANAWLGEIYDDFKQAYERLTGASVRLHVRDMPFVFRIGGAIGTHWMLPRQISVHDPRVHLSDGNDPAHPIKLDRESFRCLINATYDSTAVDCLRDESRAARDTLACWLGIGQLESEQRDFLRPRYSMADCVQAEGNQ